jgi:hypothetical protein
MISGMKIYGIVILLLLGLSLDAQNIVKITTSSDTINFGETADILIEVSKVDRSRQYLNYNFSAIRNLLYESDSAFFEPFADVFVEFEDKSLYPFYNVEEKKLDIQLSNFESKSTVLIPAKIKFLSFGEFLIHPPRYQDQNGNTIPLLSNEIRIFVLIPPGMEQTEEVDVNEIKPIVEVYESFWSKYGGYILGVIVVALIIYLINKYYHKLKNRPILAEEVKEEKPDPYTVAMSILENLNKEKPWLTGDIKEYQTCLTRTIRAYIEGRYDINAMEMTTSEIMDHLQNKPLESNLKFDLSDILQVADLVKFAKAKPSSDVHQDFLDKAIHFVVKTRKFHSA